MNDSSSRQRLGLLPKGQKNLGEKKKAPSHLPVRPIVNGRIVSEKVAVCDESGESYGVLPLREALLLARSKSVDLIQISGDSPPQCILKDFGKFLFEQQQKH